MFILGEDFNKYRVELRSLYFEFKNIISKEIELYNDDMDINQFFDEEANKMLQIDKIN